MVVEAVKGAITTVIATRAGLLPLEMLVKSTKEMGKTTSRKKKKKKARKVKRKYNFIVETRRTGKTRVVSRISTSRSLAERKLIKQYPRKSYNIRGAGSSAVK